MSNKAQEISDAIVALLKEGNGLQLKLRPAKEKLSELGVAYEIWYSKASSVVAQLAPERLTDFRAYYKSDGRKNERESDTINHYLAYTPGEYDLAYQPDAHFSSAVARQLAILVSVGHLATSILRDVKTVLRAELFDSDMVTAREMFKAKHLRCAGVIAGVVLEAHLASVADRRQITVAKKKPTLSDWNDVLKDKVIYDTPMWRLIQRLADIRNACAHSGGTDPKPDQVEDLLDGTDKVIKEVF